MGGYTCANCGCAFDGVSPEADQRAADDQLCADCCELEGELDDEVAGRLWDPIIARRVYQRVMG